MRKTRRGGTAWGIRVSAAIACAASAALLAAAPVIAQTAPPPTSSPGILGLTTITGGTLQQPVTLKPYDAGLLMSDMWKVFYFGVTKEVLAPPKAQQGEIAHLAAQINPPGIGMHSATLYYDFVLDNRAVYGWFHPLAQKVEFGAGQEWKFSGSAYIPAGTLDARMVRYYIHPELGQLPLPQDLVPKNAPTRVPSHAGGTSLALVLGSLIGGAAVLAALLWAFVQRKRRGAGSGSNDRRTPVLSAPGR